MMNTENYEDEDDDSDDDDDEILKNMKHSFSCQLAIITTSAVVLLLLHLFAFKMRKGDPLFHS